MDIFAIFKLLGGIGLFLYGMSLLGASLEKLAGAGLERTLERLTNNRLKGLALGTAAHAIGTAKAMEMGEIEGAMSSLAIAVAGLLTVVTASVFAGLMETDYSLIVSKSTLKEDILDVLFSYRSFLLKHRKK